MTFRRKKSRHDPVSLSRRRSRRDKKSDTESSVFSPVQLQGRLVCLRVLHRCPWCALSVVQQYKRCPRTCARYLNAHPTAMYILLSYRRGPTTCPCRAAVSVPAHASSSVYVQQQAVRIPGHGILTRVLTPTPTQTTKTRILLV